MKRYLSFMIILILYIGTQYGNTETKMDFTYYFTTDGTAVITGCNVENENIVIPADIDGVKVTAIGEGAFTNCYYIKTITIPSEVIRIETNAFSECRNLVKYDVDSKNDYYEAIDGVLYDKVEKKLIAYPAGNSASHYTIIDGTRIIASSAFSYCHNLMKVQMPQGIIEIEPTAFLGCSALAKINLPDSVTIIGKRAFEGCTSLSNIVIPKNVIGIGECAFISSGLKNVILSDGIKYIGKEAFSGCTKMENISIPESILAVGDYAFRDCTSLKTIVIPNSVEEIGEHSFYNCYNLTISTPWKSTAFYYAQEQNISFSCPDSPNWYESRYGILFLSVAVLITCGLFVWKVKYSKKNKETAEHDTTDNNPVG